MTTQPTTAPDYPLVRPEAPSPEGQHLYSRLSARGWLSPDTQQVEENQGSAAELIAAGLLTERWSGRPERVALAAHYTRVVGAGEVLVVVRQATLHFPRKGPLLAVVEGATTTLRKDGVAPELTIRAHHGTATDVEHSTSRLFSADIVLPQLLEAHDAETLWASTLTEFHAYAAGTDPLTIDDGDTRPGTCEDCERPHPFAPYLPPRIRLGTQLVTVEILPLHTR